MGDLGSITGLGRSPGEGNSNPLQYSCLENSMDMGAWWATVHGIAKSWTQLSEHFMSFCGRELIFFFLLNNILSFGCTTVYISIQLLKDIMVAVKFWQLCIKLLQTSVWRFCVDVHFQLLWVNMIIGLYSKSIFSFLMNHQTIFESGCTILHSHHKCTRVPIALQPHLQNMRCCQCYGIWPFSQVCIGSFASFRWASNS